MKFQHKKNNNILVITPETPSLDAMGASHFKNQVCELIKNDKNPFVVIDLSNLNTIDTTGLGSFLALQRHLNTCGGSLNISCMNRPVRTMFELVSMHKIFKIFNTTEEAVNDFDTKE